MEERLLNEEDEELYGLKLRVHPLEDDEGERLEASADNFFVQVESDEEDEEAEFDFPEAEEDDEELESLTPEEARDLLREREARTRQEELLFEELLTEGEEALANKDFDTARERFTHANELQPDDLRLNVGYFRAYSEDFTDWSDVDGVKKVYAQCLDSAKESFAQAIKTQFQSTVSEMIAENERRLPRLQAEEDRARAERAERYTHRVKRSGGWLLVLGSPCVLSALAALILLAFIHSIPGDLIAVLSAAFGGAAVVLLIPTLFFLKQYLNATRLQEENKREDSTAAGRKIQTLRRATEWLKEVFE